MGKEVGEGEKIERGGMQVYRMKGTYGRYINIFWGYHLVFRWDMENGDGQDDFKVQVTTMILRRYQNRLNFTNSTSKSEQESAIIAFNIMQCNKEHEDCQALRVKLSKVSSSRDP